MPKTGVLPDHMLREFVGVHITGVDQGFVNSASIDMELESEAYRLETIFLPRANMSVRKMFKDIGARPYDLANPLEVGVAYLIRVKGEWSLPPSVYGYSNPKSSSGRVNLFCRLVADGVAKYDHLPNGWAGECWFMVRPDSFPIVLSPGLAVGQLRLFDGKSFLNQVEQDLAVKRTGLIFDERGHKITSSRLHQHADSIYLTLDVREEFGFECRGTHKPLDFGKVRHHDQDDFFTPIAAPGGKYVLRKNGFYILSTRERVMVPPNLSAELRPIDVRLGEFRSHRAGYIDPGWGYGSDGTVCGRPITLEVIPHEDMLVYHGQTIARIRYEHMQAVPTDPYDSAKSNYTEQMSAKLSKHFRAR